MFIKEGPNTKCVYEQRNVIEHDNEKFRYFLKERDVERLKSFNCKSGDILITCAGTIGEQYILPSESPTGIFNQALMRVRLQTNVDRTIFSVCFDKMISYSKQKYSNGSAIKNIPPLKDLKNRVVYLPKLEEQEYIAKFIELLSKKINLLNLKISTLKKYKEGIMKLCLSLSQNEGKTLKRLVSENELRIGRGTIIPRQEGIYPVYSSSAKNDGLFCYTNFYKYDEDLITWSIDGGGQPFYRKKHKFSITNVCGFIKIIDFAKWDYTWLYINIWNNWCRNKFDYTSKAHPSIIEEIYKIKPLSLDKQKKISMVFLAIEKHEKNLESKLNKLKEIKKYLLSNLFI